MAHKPLKLKKQRKLNDVWLDKQACKHTTKYYYVELREPCYYQCRECGKSFPVNTN